MTRNPSPPPTPNYDSVADSVVEPVDDDRFNDAVDAIRRGESETIEAIDPAMQSTIAQLFAWASLSGYADEPPTASGSKSGTQAITEIPSRSYPLKREDQMQQATFPITPGTLRTSSPGSASGSASGRHRPHPVIALLSTIAALLLIGLAAYGARPLLTGRDGPKPLSAPSEIAVQAAQSPDSAFADSGPGNAIPTIDPESTNGYLFPPLAESDCNAEPLDRTRILGILNTPPAASASIVTADSAADQATLDLLNKTLRAWEACGQWGHSEAAMTYETEAYIRESIYGDPRIDQAYSEPTLNEILDARFRANQQQAEQSNGGTGEDVFMIDPKGSVFISEDGLNVQADVIAVQANDGSQEDPAVTFHFVFEDGTWKIRLTGEYVLFY